jgi:hypothetical protein
MNYEEVGWRNYDGGSVSPDGEYRCMMYEEIHSIKHHYINYFVIHNSYFNHQKI